MMLAEQDGRLGRFSSMLTSTLFHTLFYDDTNANNINDSRYTFVIHPSIALYYIERLYAIGYSLHIDVSDNGQGKGIQITVKNKKSQTLHISRRAKEMLEPYIKQ
jgi:hypothetical protein